MQIKAHSAVTFSIPRNRNCLNPLACLICPNTGSTTCFRNRYLTIRGGLELVPHGLGERPCDLSLDVAGMLGASGRDVTADVARGQGGKVRLAAVAGIGGSLPGLAVEIVLGRIQQRHELVLIAHARRQAMGDDDLGLGIDQPAWAL